MFSSDQMNCPKNPIQGIFVSDSVPKSTSKQLPHKKSFFWDILSFTSSSPFHLISPFPLRDTQLRRG